MYNFQKSDTAGNNSFEEKRGGALSADRVKRHKILIVDDDDFVGIGMSEMLNDAGFDASYVVSGRDALNEMKRGDTSLVFMDMSMPVMNGLDTYRALRSFDSRAKVIILTGFFKDIADMVSQGVREGMIDLYIRKPFYAEEIISVVRKYV